LAFIWRRDGWKNLRCFAFGVPSVLDEHHCEVAKEFTYSFIMKNDVIPRIGIVTSVRMKEQIVRLLDDKPAVSLPDPPECKNNTY